MGSPRPTPAPPRPVHLAATMMPGIATRLAHFRESTMQTRPVICTHHLDEMHVMISSEQNGGEGKARGEGGTSNIDYCYHMPKKLFVENKSTEGLSLKV